MSEELDTWLNVSTAIGTVAAAGAAWWTAWLARRSAADSARSAAHALEALARTVRPTLDVWFIDYGKFVLQNSSPFDAVDIDLTVTTDGRPFIRKTGLTLAANSSRQEGWYDVSSYEPGAKGPDVEVEITYCDARRTGRWLMTGSCGTTIDFVLSDEVDPETGEQKVAAKWPSTLNVSPVYRYLGPA